MADANIDGITITMYKEGPTFSANLCGLRVNSYYIFTQMVSGGLEIFRQGQHWFMTLKSRSYDNTLYENFIKQSDEIKLSYNGYTLSEKRNALKSITQKKTKSKD